MEWHGKSIACHRIIMVGHGGATGDAIRLWMISAKLLLLAGFTGRSTVSTSQSQHVCQQFILFLIMSFAHFVTDKPKDGRTKYLLFLKTIKCIKFLNLIRQLYYFRPHPVHHRTKAIVKRVFLFSAFCRSLCRTKQ